MKKIQHLMYVVAAALVWTGCGSAPESDKAEASEAREVADADAASTRYNVQTQQSQITWVGSKLVGGNHEGVFTIQDGTLAVEDDRIVAGSFTIDMESLRATDEMDAEDKAKLEGHLKSEDFFKVSEYPTSKFEVTEVRPFPADSSLSGEGEYRISNPTHLITGNLTLRGETKSITFPARIGMDNEQLTAEARFNIDRTQWNVSYGSDASVRDRIINKEVNLGIRLVASKGSQAG